MRRRYLIAGAVAALIAAVAAAGAVAAKPRFAPAPRADIVGKRLFDIGVADPDRDGWQDIYTTNHKFRSVFMRNAGGRSFRNEVDEIGLGPDNRFPGLDLLRPPADMSAAGVYIWPSDEPGDAGRLHLQSSGIQVSGRLRFMTRKVRLRSASAAEAEIGRDSSNRPLVDFSIRPGGRVTVSSNGLSDLPIQFEFTESGPGAVAPEQIKVGTEAVSPAARLFQIKLRDRHALAFADVAGDRDQDVFVSTGGLGGGIAGPRFYGYVVDQFMVSGAGGYTDAIALSSIAKGACRGRSVAYADADGGGRPDLLTTCEGAAPRLYAYVARGAFVQVVGPPVVGTVYRWAQLGRGKPSLLVSTRRGIEVWKSRRGVWRRSDTVRAGREAHQIALGDYDNSGTLDVLVTGKRRLVLLTNRHGRLHPVRSRRGLPRSAAAASFVDYDNDGRLDVSLAPQGLYRWSRHRGRFTATGVLRRPRTGYAIVEWMDFDNDGRRDPLIATSSREFSPRSRITRRRNKTRAGHWLEVELTGSVRNREALGSRVTAHLRHGRRITQWVGQNDDARHSQGHYRLYFGLGRTRKVRRLVVDWPGRARTRMKRVRGDRLLRVSRSG